MGLSASQTRFLSLTARKSNVEFQGQQINQARTALANQSSELFTQMMSLQAPVAPSPYKYVIDPAQNPNIDWSQDNAYPLSASGMKDFNAYYAGNKPQFVDFNIPMYEEVFEKDANGVDVSKGFALVSYDEKGVKHYGEKKVDSEGNVTYEPTYYAKDEIPGTHCTTEMGEFSSGVKKSYISVHVEESQQEIYYYDAKTNTFAMQEGHAVTELPAYLQAYNQASSMYNTYSKPNKTPIYEEGTNYDGLKTETTEDDPTPVAYQMTATETQCSAQYDQAMVQYEIDLAEYERALEEINIKTEDIHEADKKLELQLKQLDTEQEAINTEYEAVKKVIDKNIENTFKTFA